MVLGPNWTLLGPFGGRQGFGGPAGPPAGTPSGGPGVKKFKKIANFFFILNDIFEVPKGF